MVTRVLVVDDQPVVRAGFAAIIGAQPDLEVVAEAADGREAIEQAARHRPDVVVMDIRMPVLDGIEATRRLTAPGVSSPPRVLVLTTFDLDDYVFAALQAGASGFLLKDVPRDELLRGVRLVAAGDALLAPSVARRLITEFAQRPPPAPSPDRAADLERLTRREHEVLVELGRGRSNAEIAATLFVGEATVKTHVAHVLMKLGLRDRIQAVIYAYETGVVSPHRRSTG